MFPPNPKNLTVVMLGAGNVASHLTRSLLNAGHKIVQIFGRTKQSTSELAKNANCSYTLNIDGIIKDADLYIMAVPDASIGYLAQTLPKLNGIVVHTSGSTPISTLNKLSDNYGVFYPFQTFSKSRELNLTNTPFCIEASSEEVSELLFNLSKSLGGKPIKMDSETRQWLHLSGVFSSNFVNHMLTIAQLIAEEKGISFDMLKPLINETISKAIEKNPFDSQTGPAIRGDAETIKKHVAMLSDIDDDIRELYMNISSSIWNLQNTSE
jgi:predicted short-subunit dehydrogenase-like oxidoreductase (DUF2520 family)